ncbi:CGNR zinc finger domain-containing protein [Lacrimispora sp.]|uniref:CGNR zinc finger domain-containing protein n=1 Tax=Lacrimispora sp. TaxID=2719234 RepID=UPI003FA60363
MLSAAASFSTLISSEAVNHLKTCQNPECGWFFLDESKRENRKWCSDTCATLMKDRRFRERQKENKFYVIYTQGSCESQH